MVRRFVHIAIIALSVLGLDATTLAVTCLHHWYLHSSETHHELLAVMASPEDDSESHHHQDTRTHYCEFGTDAAQSPDLLIPSPFDKCVTDAAVALPVPPSLSALIFTPPAYSPAPWLDPPSKPPQLLS